MLITGGTGSFGREFVRVVLAEHDPAAIRIYSRDELKQWEMARELRDDSRLRFLIGDVRNRDRLRMALRGVDVVIHAAALKHVPVCEYNPFEAVQTNVNGAENVVAAAIDNHVPRTLALSTDKAVHPVNLYGATKLCAEKIVTQGNSYAGDTRVRFASVRYGNVVGSRGSVVSLFEQQARTGELTITDESMTRFWITLKQAVDFVISSLSMMQGGEVFVPRIPSMQLRDLADALAPGTPRRVVGIRPGEKIHEVLITEDESRHARTLPDRYVIYPPFPFWSTERGPLGDPLPSGFRYSSDANVEWLDAGQIRAMAKLVTAGE
ncbi:MAG: UDP-N-acetylglucosamine 4,6-dehydratase (inverting) [Solirubrobacteraceae bacterium]